MRRLLRRVPLLPAEKPKHVAWDPSRARFAGCYRSTRWGETKSVLLNDKLAMINPWATTSRMSRS